MATRRRRPLTPEAELNYLAHRAAKAQAYGFRVHARAGRSAATGRIVRTTMDHPSSADPGSNLTVHFDSGATLPLERISSLERAGD